MVDFVQDVRAEFNEPALPFIIGGPGMDGYNSRGKAKICNAQSNAATRPEINETTIYIETRIFAARYSCLGLDDDACDGLSNAGCNGDEDSPGCACNDLIETKKDANPDYKRQCGYKVYDEQGQHWSWNGRSEVGLGLGLWGSLGSGSGFRGLSL
jgi:hypothetical protein